MKGYTIIELMIACAILAILAAIAIPAFSGGGNRTRTYNQQITNNLTYFKDQRTGICFARNTMDSRMFTQVDCEQVKAYLQ